MEKKYLTISEFAGLRNVSIGSLRYYEKLGILVPAKISPDTGYCYYLPEQLGTLDSILLCISLDIPLKNMKNYIDENGVLEQREILISGRQVMQEKIAQMQKKLALTQFNLDRMEQNEKYGRKDRVYTRNVEERFLIAQPVSPDWIESPKRETRRPMELFREAQEKDMDPVFPSGIFIRNPNGQSQFFFYLQVLHPNPEDPRIIRIPEGEYTCLQLDLSPRTDLKRLIHDNFPDINSGMIIVSNMLMNKAHLSSFHSEIQIIPE